MELGRCSRKVFPGDAGCCEDRDRHLGGACRGQAGRKGGVACHSLGSISSQSVQSPSVSPATDSSASGLGMGGDRLPGESFLRGWGPCCIWRVAPER